MRKSRSCWRPPLLLINSIHWFRFPQCLRLKNNEYGKIFSACLSSALQMDYSMYVAYANSNQKLSSPFKLWAVWIVQYWEIGRWSLVGIKYLFGAIYEYPLCCVYAVISTQISKTFSKATKEDQGTEKQTRPFCALKINKSPSLQWNLTLR